MFFDSFRKDWYPFVRHDWTILAMVYTLIFNNDSDMRWGQGKNMMTRVLTQPPRNKGSDKWRTNAVPIQVLR